MDNYQQYADALAYKIIDVMREKNIDRNDLANKLGVTPRTAARHLSGMTAIQYKTLLRIAEALGVPIGAIVPGCNERIKNSA